MGMGIGSLALTLPPRTGTHYLTQNFSFYLTLRRWSLAQPLMQPGWNICRVRHYDMTFTYLALSTHTPARHRLDGAALYHEVLWRDRYQTYLAFSRNTLYVSPLEHQVLQVTCFMLPDRVDPLLEDLRSTRWDWDGLIHEPLSLLGTLYTYQLRQKLASLTLFQLLKAWANAQLRDGSKWD